MQIPEWFQIGVSVVALFSGVVFALVKLTRKRKNNRLKAFWSAHSRIHETLTELRILNNCARIHLVQFHNGEYFMDGVSMKKLSLTHESLNKGTSCQGNNIQGLSISRFMPLINKLISEDFSLNLVNNLEESYFKQFMMSGNALGFITLPLRYRGMITGYIMCQWCSLKKIDDIDEKTTKKALEIARNSVEILLSQQLKTTEK